MAYSKESFTSAEWYAEIKRIRTEGRNLKALKAELPPITCGMELADGGKCQRPSLHVSETWTHRG